MISNLANSREITLPGEEAGRRVSSADNLTLQDATGKFEVRNRQIL